VSILVSFFDSFFAVVRSLALGNEYGVAVVDILQKVCLLNIGTPDLYGMPRLFIIVMICSDDETVLETIFDKISNAVQFFNAKFYAYAS